MTETFDPYQKWLGISPKHQPPHHYRLLGLELFESDPDTIDNAATRQMAHIRTYQTSAHLELSQKILNEIARAQHCLLNPEKKSNYDAKLKARLAQDSGVLQAKPMAASDSGLQPILVAKTVPAAPIPVAKAVPGERSHATATADSGVHDDGLSKPSLAAPAAKSTPAWVLPAAIGGGAGLLCLLILGVAIVVSNGKPPKDPTTGTIAGVVDPAATPPVIDQSSTHEENSASTAASSEQDSERSVDEGNEEEPERSVDPPGGVATVDPPQRNPIPPGFGGGLTPSPAVVPGSSDNETDSGKHATLDITSPCQIGTLRVGAPVMSNHPDIFTRVPSELQDYQYTVWPDEEMDLMCFVRSSGEFYMLVRVEDAENYRRKMPPSACRPTSLECLIGSPDEASQQRYAVYRWNLTQANRLEISPPPNTSRPLFVSKTMFRTNTAPLTEDNELAARGNEDPEDPYAAGFGNAGEDTTDPPPAGDTPPAGVSIAAPPVKRLPLPSSAAQAPLLKQVREIYEISKLETPQDQSRVAKSLISEGQKVTDSPEEQFVMFRVGCELASEAGDLKTALAGVDAIGQRFEADAVLMRMKMAERAAKARVPPSVKTEIIESALSIIDQAMAEDHLVPADRLADSLQSTVRTLKDKDLMTALAKRRSMLTTALNAFRKVASARETLKSDPDDPDANTAMGHYLCFVRGRWDNGLPLLAKGSDDNLKALAAKDLSQPGEAVAQWQVAEGWYGLSDKQPEHISASLQLRAQYWYEKSLSGLTGIKKAGTEKRLAEIKEATADALVESTPSMTWPARATILADADYRYELYINGTQYASGHGTSSSSLRPVSVMLNKGDTVLVKAGRGSGNRRAFACVIGFPGTKRIIATGARNSGWQSYRPEETYSWYRVGQGKAIGPVLPAAGLAAQRIMATAGIRCANIWGSYDDQPTSSYGYTYFILTIQ